MTPWVHVNLVLERSRGQETPMPWPIEEARRPLMLDGLPVFYVGEPFRPRRRRLR